MKDLRCKYLGLELKNPIVIGSCGLTGKLDHLIRLEQAGAGAVVLKSIFEEQILFESTQFIQSSDPAAKAWSDAFETLVAGNEYYYEEAYNYLTNYAKDHSLASYLQLISDAKAKLSIPVIASINCTTDHDWEYFARKIQDAGADALELNLYLLPSGMEKQAVDNEKLIEDILLRVKQYVSIPISLKIGFYFTNLAMTAVELSHSGIAGLTLFNRPYNPDIDIDKLSTTATHIFSSAQEYSNTLRWVAILSGKVGCDLAASTGVHSGDTIIKQLLAGAQVVQVVSVLYQQPYSIIGEMLKDIETWMEKHQFSTLDDFRGKLSQARVQNPASYERVQFIRHYSSIE